MGVMGGKVLVNMRVGSGKADTHTHTRIKPTQNTRTLIELCVCVYVSRYGSLPQGLRASLGPVIVADDNKNLLTTAIPT